MHDDQIVQGFIERRAQGWTYARLMTELNVSKPTLIAWSRKHQFQIQNLKAIELEALREKYQAYQSYPDVTRRRMYLEAMEEVLKGMESKTIIDAELNKVLPLLPLGEGGLK